MHIPSAVIDKSTKPKTMENVIENVSRKYITVFKFIRKHMHNYLQSLPLDSFIQLIILYTCHDLKAL